MPSEVINRVNQTGLTEWQPFLLPTNIYYRKGNTIGDDDTNIEVVYKAPEITVVDEETEEKDEHNIKNYYPQDNYNTTDVYIKQDMQKYD